MNNNETNKDNEQRQVEAHVMLPECLDDLYMAVEEMGNPDFCFDTNDPMDNIVSMTHFLDGITDLKDSDISLHDGTQVYIKATGRKEIVLDSGGRGDMYSHIVTAKWTT